MKAEPNVKKFKVNTSTFTNLPNSQMYGSKMASDQRTYSRDSHRSPTGLDSQSSSRAPQTARMPQSYSQRSDSVARMTMKTPSALSGAGTGSMNTSYRMKMQSRASPSFKDTELLNMHTVEKYL